MFSFFFIVHLLLSLVVGEPGCSFRNDECMYNVRLGKAGSCGHPKGETADDASCCGNIKVDIHSLQNEVNDLARTLSGLHDVTQSTQATILPTSSPTANEQHLMQILAKKEAELQNSQTILAQKKVIMQSISASLLQKEYDVNTSKAILSQVTVQYQEEVRRMKEHLANTTRDLNNCRGVLALNTASKQNTQALATPYSLTYCPFENGRLCGYAQDNSDQDNWYQMAGSPSAKTGPLEDHTYGSPRGHYIAINPSKSATTTRPTKHVARVTSLPFDPAPNYCIRFWYNMYGVDIKTLNVYAKVGGGRGYPVWTTNGDHGHDWHLGEVNLDSEYTHTPFSVVFEANHEAYYTTYTFPSHHHGSVLHEVNDDIAVDDVYVYNVSCKSLPTCPPDSFTWQRNGSKSCYTFHTTPEDWYQSHVICHKEGATSNLVSINSKEEQEYLVTTIRNDPGLSAAGSYGWFTSGNDERSEHHFDWTDTGTPYTSKYTNWHAGQPNNVGNVQDCLLLQYADSDYEWGDVKCTEKHPFICEVEMPTV